MATDAWSAQTYNKNANFVYSDKFTAPVLALLDPKPGENILDLGCGSGELTLKLTELVKPQGYVVGTDFSDSMVAQAQKNGVEHCFVADAQAHQFPAPYAGRRHNFDAVFTNAALHWCKRDPDGVIKSVKAMLRPGGRFVGEFGGFMNCIGLRSALHAVLRCRGYNPVSLDPWFFPSPEDYRKRLEAQGFQVVDISLTPRFTSLPGHVIGWMETFVRSSFLSKMDDQEALAIMEEVAEHCAVSMQDENGNWAVMYTRLRFAAVLAQ